METLIPDDARRAEIEAEMPAIPLALYESPIVRVAYHPRRLPAAERALPPGGTDRHLVGLAGGRAPRYPPRHRQRPGIGRSGPRRTRQLNPFPARPTRALSAGRR
jgi:hypothetical protein